MPDALALELDMPDADVIFCPEFFSAEEADALFEALKIGIEWRQKSIKLFGKEVAMPRLTAWYGNPGAVYTYSGLTETPLMWTPELLQIRDRVNEAAGVGFNSVLLNYYRTGADSMSWHSDDEPELGRNPVIASVTFGAPRKFRFKHKSDPALRAEVELTHGSLLLMRGPTQRHWKHQLPKTTRPLGARINLTFRVIHMKR
jgi:alkylated DNA repair dioxygenase AlkB